MSDQELHTESHKLSSIQHSNFVLGGNSQNGHYSPTDWADYQVI